MSNLISDMTWIEAKEKLNGAIVIIPVGSNEQHGQHMPLNCDSFYVTEIVSRLLKKINGVIPVYRTPTVWAGYSPHHREFAGTISLRLSTFFALVYDICVSLINHKVRHIFLINGHGGNYPPLCTIASELGDSLGKAPVVLNYWDVINKEEWKNFINDLAGIGHAGEVETSFRLYLAPETIRKDQLEKAEFVIEDPHPPTNIFYQFKRFKDVNPRGYTGHPKWATKEKGERIIKRIVELLSNILIETYNKKES